MEYVRLSKMRCSECVVRRHPWPVLVRGEYSV